MLPLLKVSASSAEISSQLSVDVAKLSAHRIAETGRFTVAISGGSLPSILSKELKNNSSVEWPKWHVFLADERCVPNSHADSNMFLLQKELLNAVPIPSNQIHAINDSLLTSENGACSDAETASIANDYKTQLESVFGSNIEFDLILLGMGPDGHTCSLFPGHLLLNVTSTSVAYLIDSPKPPPARITLTYSVLNAAKHVYFVSTGEGKAEVLHDILIKGAVYPSGLVKPQSAVVWYLDKPAAKRLGSMSSL
ncbi:UNVERIFIED_CONTAM: 6-phosphogluconolactonase [Siphonaria sp. JEL0065]|nr:6-phosphogluconolactonase [Siphonaria sp. JEL0065]